MSDQFNRWLSAHDAELRNQIAAEIEALPDAYVPSTKPGISFAGYVDKRLPILIARGRSSQPEETTHD